MALHIVHAQEVRAPAVAVERGGDRGGHPVRGDLAAGERAQEALARDAQQQRAESRKARQRAQQREVVRERLAEADAGIERDALRGHARRDRGLGALGEERLDLGHDVVVARVVLHRARLAEHVHEAEVGARLGDHRRHLAGLRAARSRH